MFSTEWGSDAFSILQAHCQWIMSREILSCVQSTKTVLLMWPWFCKDSLSIHSYYLQVYKINQKKKYIYTPYSSHMICKHIYQNACVYLYTWNRLMCRRHSRTMCSRSLQSTRLGVCIFISSLKIGSSVLFFQIPHIRINMGERRLQREGM